MDISRQIVIEQKRYQQIQNNVKNIAGFQKEIAKVLGKDITQITQVILAGANTLDSSDIHFEPSKNQALIRIRLDGFLQEVTRLDASTYNALLSRIKLLSEIKLNITKTSQDGRFTMVLGETSIEIRVSTLPAEFGESIVMRLLSPKNILTLEQLGISQGILEAIDEQIRQPHGLIIITGPTGSGKTTTLYAILQKIKNPGIKIITIEDPIEYHLDSISQTQVDKEKGYDFANGLSAIVRQDPDVILVGEIRDSQTAKIALQAALTGHLVLSTLHTNDAAGTVARLQALDESPSNIAPAVRLIVAQRLVRKVCRECSMEQIPTAQEIKIFKTGLGPLLKTLLPALDITKTKIPKARACPLCNETGYNGRTGIFEFLIIDEEMQNFILKAPSIADLNSKAKDKGMLTMRQDGLIKTLQGITTLEEVIRETGSE